MVSFPFKILLCTLLLTPSLSFAKEAMPASKPSNHSNPVDTSLGDSSSFDSKDSNAPFPPPSGVIASGAVGGLLASGIGTMVLGTGAIAAVSVGLNKKSQDKGIKNRAYGLMVDPSKKIGKLAKLTKELEKTKRPLRKVKEDSSLEKNPEKLKKEELRSVPTIEAEIQKEKETIEVSNPDKNAGAWKRLMNYLGIGRSDDYKEYRTQKLAKENLARNFIELSDMEKKYGISPEDQAKNNKLKQMAKDKKGGYERARKRLNTFNEQGFKRLSKSDMTFLEKKKALIPPENYLELKHHLAHIEWKEAKILKHQNKLERLKKLQTATKKSSSHKKIALPIKIVKNKIKQESSSVIYSENRLLEGKSDYEESIKARKSNITGKTQFALKKNPDLPEDDPVRKWVKEGKETRKRKNTEKTKIEFERRVKRAEIRKQAKEREEKRKSTS